LKLTQNKKYSYDILSALSLINLGEWKPDIKKENKKEIIKIESDKADLSLNCYPNPFNPVTTISFNLVKSGYVTLKIYDMIGREVKTLISETKAIGSCIIPFDGSRLASGSYIYRLSVIPDNGGKEIIIQKNMQIIK
jgi:hypothetical protein